MKRFFILLLAIACALSLASCGTKMPYDLSGTASVELHAYNNDSTEPFAKIVVDGEEVATIVEMFSSLKLKKLDYTEPSIKGYEFWFKDANGNQIAKLSLPYGSSPWVVSGGTAYQDVNGGVDLDLLAQMVDIAVTTGPQTDFPGSGERNGRPYAPYIGNDVTQAEAMHVCAGQVKEWTVSGDELDALREWANALDYEHTTFAEGESPAEGEGAEMYSFTLTEGDYPGFTYYHGDSAYLNIEGEWFSVATPSRPPVAGLD